MLPLVAESWIWYAIAVLIIAARYISRWLQLGQSFKSFQLEDYIMLAVLVFYTSLVANINIIDHTETNLMLPSDVPLLTPESIKNRIYGSKLVLVIEQSMIMTQWGCKFSLLLLYNKLTFGLRQQIAVKVVAVYVLINLIVMEILYFGVWCRPFEAYYQVPTPNIQCSTAIHHLITNTVFNISSDVLMLLIPLPLLLRSRLPPANKLILCGLFSLGIFVILCAVLNKYYSFANPFAQEWENWYIREASTAIYVANMPMCWSLLRRIFHLGSFDGVTSAEGRSRSGPKLQGFSDSAADSNTAETGVKSKRESSWWDREAGFTEWRSNSEEHMKVSGPNSAPLEIWEERQVDIDRGSVVAIQQPNASYHDSSKNVEVGMFDGTGPGMGFESRTTVSATKPLGRSSSKKRLGSRSRSRAGTGSGSDEGSKLGAR